MVDVKKIKQGLVIVIILWILYFYVVPMTNSIVDWRGKFDLTNPDMLRVGDVLLIRSSKIYVIPIHIYSMTYWDHTAIVTEVTGSGADRKVYISEFYWFPNHGDTAFRTLEWNDYIKSSFVQDIIRVPVNSKCIQGQTRLKVEPERYNRIRYNLFSTNCIWLINEIMKLNGLSKAKPLRDNSGLSGESVTRYDALLETLQTCYEVDTRLLIYSKPNIIWKTFISFIDVFNIEELMSDRI